MKLTVVGSSGSFGGPHSAASCYLLQVPVPGQDRPFNLVLDLGPGGLGGLQKLISLEDIDAIVLSHLHPDHCLDVCGLFVVQKYNPAPKSVKRRIPVYGPEDTGARLSRANGVTQSEASDPHGMDSEFDFRTVWSGEIFELGPLHVTARRVNHPVEAYGFRIEHEGKVLTFTGDTDTCPALGPLMAGADLVLADSAFVEGRDTVPDIHLSGRRAAQAAIDAGGVRHLVLTHVPPWNDPQVGMAEAREIWDGTLSLASPGASFEV